MKQHVFNRFPGVISPFMMAGVLVVLLPIFGIMTLDRMEKHKAHIKEQLQVKGISLIRTFEAGTRIGMLTMQWSDRRIQAMLQETALQPDVSYILIVSKTGHILAHSDADQVGKTMDTMPDIRSMAENIRSVGNRIRSASGEKVFEVYKRFTPLKGGGRGPRGRHKMFHDMLKRSGIPLEDWPPEPGPPFVKELGHGMMQDQVPDQYIFVGLSMARADQAQARLLRETIGRGLLFFVMGCAGMISLIAFQAYRSAKASLTSVKAFSDNVVQNMPSGLMTTDLENRITSMNRSAREILGEKPDRPFPEMRDMIRELAAKGKTVSREVARGDGDTALRLDMTASFIRDNENAVLGYLFLFRDMTQLEQLKEEVETTRHLAAIGKLAAGVAHEIRNPLSSIKGFATYFEKRYQDNADDQQTARIMVREVERINRSITQLLEFAKPMAVEIRPAEIEPLISHSLKLLQHDLEQKQIEVKVDIRTTEPVIATDPDRINQVLLNLYMNALAAMEEGGSLRVDVLDTDDGRTLEIRVRDDGAGIAPEYLASVFDPYFTTRSDGTGLGLSIVHRIIENLGGRIRAESSPGEGTEFIIQLPRTRADKRQE